MPPGNEWLCPGENSRLAELRFSKRRRDWRLGRWTAKRMIAACLNLPRDSQALQDIEIKAASSGAPEVFLFGERAAVRLSISHRAGKAFCVIGPSGVYLGCDLEIIESREDSFLADFFTENEKNLIFDSPLSERPLLTTLAWSAKESVLKAMNVGLRLDTALLEVTVPDRQHARGCSDHHDYVLWRPLLIRCADQMIHGCWGQANNMVRTVVSTRWSLCDDNSQFPRASPRLLRAQSQAEPAVACSRPT